MDAIDVIEPGTQSFIVKVWVEDSSETTSQVAWHGHITHIPSHERHYLHSLDEIPAFIAPHLEAMGVQTSKHRRFQQWLQRFRKRK